MIERDIGDVNRQNIWYPTSKIILLYRSVIIIKNCLPYLVYTSWPRMGAPISLSWVLLGRSVSDVNARSLYPFGRNIENFDMYHIRPLTYMANSAHVLKWLTLDVNLDDQRQFNIGQNVR